MIFLLPFDDWECSAAADDFETAVSAILANTAGKRIRVVSLSVGPADNVPGDEDIGVRIGRTDNTTAGTAGSTVAVADVPKADSLSMDSPASGGKAYTVEPTTITTLWSSDMNARSVAKWDLREENIIGNRNETIIVAIAPRDATVKRLSGCLVIEAF